MEDGGIFGPVKCNFQRESCSDLLYHLVTNVVDRAYTMYAMTDENLGSLPTRRAAERRTPSDRAKEPNQQRTAAVNTASGLATKRTRHHPQLARIIRFASMTIIIIHNIYITHTVPL